MTARDRTLDGLRGAAIVAVVAAHGAGGLFKDYGLVGVTVFFVLSGYLITSILVRELDETGHVRMGAFYLRRAARLVPALAVFLALVPVVLWAADDPRLDRLPMSVLTAALYVQNIAATLGFGSVLGHTWSLATEEQFYLVWPPCLLLLGRRRPADAFRWALASFVVFALWRSVAILLFDDVRVYYGPDTNAMSLLGGCALALWWRSGRRWRPGAATTVVAVGVLVVLPFFTTRFTTAAPTLESWLPLVVVPATVVVLLARPAALAWSPLVRLGTISYALYLWHLPLLRLEPGGVPLGGPGRMLMLAAALAVATMSWIWVEAPVLDRVRGLPAARRPDCAVDLLGPVPATPQVHADGEVVETGAHGRDESSGRILSSASGES